jgi:glycosyltransferase involved in cell wall biosynthesis
MVMPVWQPRRDWLLQAVRSALGQRDCEVELIVVDDGNEQPVAPLLSEVDDPRLQVLRVSHGGSGPARNAGIAAARGDLIRFVDCDDLYAPESTARLIRLMEDREVITYGATMFCDENLRPVWKMTCGVKGWAAESCVLSRFRVRIVSMLFPRRVVDAAGEWGSFEVSGDWDFVLRALEHAPVRGERRVASWYRRHPTSATGDVAGGEAGARRVVSRYFDRHPEQRGTRLERRVQATLEAGAARARGTRGHRRESLQRLGRALALHPVAVAHEALRGIPALWGRIRYRRFIPRRAG